MKLIVGLGNPGAKYEFTRHNAGFLMLDFYAKEKGFEINKLKNKALISEQFINGEKVIFAKPQTFMNLSGDSVLLLAEYYGIDNEDIFIIYDDISLPLGKIRIRKKGSAGGHNGIKDLILKLSGDDFCRLKIGVSENGGKDLIDYVLGAFSKNELADLKKIAKKSVEIIDCYLKDGVEECMNKYNSFMLGNE
ncbi:MAG: aminoacyl-tRNA hydrolase [Ruminococcaceae bacterium]|nr:aminoacyl-tRNA hydrolase [Oscillospiraceae bacterium]